MFHDTCIIELQYTLKYTVKINQTFRALTWTRPFYVCAWRPVPFLGVHLNNLQYYSLEKIY